VTLCISQFTVVATAFVANAWLAIPITSRAVNVMGKHCVPLRLHCECDIRTTVCSGFLKHLFDSTSLRNSCVVYHARSIQQNKGKSIAGILGREFLLLLLHAKLNSWIRPFVSKIACKQLDNSIK
jgi:hypothetical protein